MRTILRYIQNYYAKSSTGDKSVLYSQIKNLFQVLFNNYSLVIHIQNAYSAIIKGVVDSTVKFLLSIADYFHVSIKVSRQFIKAGSWQEQNLGYCLL